MAFGNLTITTAGHELLSQALTGGVISFTKVENINIPVRS
jgi:hypothetical protein